MSPVSYGCGEGNDITRAIWWEVLMSKQIVEKLGECNEVLTRKRWEVINGDCYGSLSA